MAPLAAARQAVPGQLAESQQLWYNQFSITAEHFLHTSFFWYPQRFLPGGFGHMKLSAPGFVHPKNPIGPLRAAASHHQQVPGFLGRQGPCCLHREGSGLGCWSPSSW